MIDEIKGTDMEMGWRSSTERERTAGKHSKNIGWKAPQYRLAAERWPTAAQLLSANLPFTKKKKETSIHSRWKLGFTDKGLDHAHQSPIQKASREERHAFQQGLGINLLGHHAFNRVEE